MSACKEFLKRHHSLTLEPSVVRADVRTPGQRECSQRPPLHSQLATRGERGVIAQPWRHRSFETVRRWCRKFGHGFANRLRYRRRDPATGGTWTRYSSRSRVYSITYGVPWIRMALRRHALAVAEQAFRLRLIRVVTGCSALARLSGGTNTGRHFRSLGRTGCCRRIGACADGLMSGLAQRRIPFSCGCRPACTGYPWRHCLSRLICDPGLGGH